jgi:hypothetical protein
MIEPRTSARPHVCLATPCFGNVVHTNYLASVIGLLQPALSREVEISFIFRGGDSLITRCRNSIVAEFLATPAYTHLFWVDADIGFEPDAVFRLLDANQPVVAGAYPFKRLVWPDELPAATSHENFVAQTMRYSFNPLPGSSTPTEDGFLEVLDVPAGFMMIARASFERLIAARPDLKCQPEHMLGLEHLHQSISSHHYRFFDTMVDGSGRYLSEGHAFCRLWQSIGGKVFIDINSRLTHEGTQLHVGNLRNSLLAWARQA